MGGVGGDRKRNKEERKYNVLQVDRLPNAKCLIDQVTQNRNV